jgi:hypothetical protein
MNQSGLVGQVRPLWATRALWSRDTVDRMARKKNPAAVALGRLGGRKGGKARMAALTPEERSALGKLAAAAKRRKSRRT